MAELGSHFHFEFRDHAFLRIIRGAASIKHPPSQMILVVTLELVLVVQESEEDDSLDKCQLDLIVRFLQRSMESSETRRMTHGFGTLLEMFVDEQREKFRSSGIRVDK